MIIHTLKTTEKDAVSCNVCIDQGRGIKTAFTVYFNSGLLIFECEECGGLHFWVKDMN